MLIITIDVYITWNISTQSDELGNTVSVANLSDDESYTQLDEIWMACSGSAHLIYLIHHSSLFLLWWSNSNFQKIRVVVSIYYSDQPTLKMSIFTVLCKESEGDYWWNLWYDELTACSDETAVLQLYQLEYRLHWFMNADIVSEFPFTAHHLLMCFYLTFPWSCWIVLAISV